MTNTILTSVLLPPRCMDSANSTQYNSNYATNSKNETDRVDDIMAGSRSGHKRHVMKSKTPTEKKEPK